MERIFAREQLEQLFEDTAERHTRELLFSSVVGIMSLVVCGIYPSVGAAYKAVEKVVGVHQRLWVIPKPPYSCFGWH